MDPLERERQVEFLRRWSRWLDSAYRVPGTGVRFGWDPIIGLVPGAGEFLTTAFGALVLYKSVRLGVPRVVLARMVLNLLIDFAAGSVPVVGDLFDFAWKSNDMNLALLLRHTRPNVRPTSGDWAFVVSILVAVASAAALVVLVVAWAANQVLRLFT